MIYQKFISFITPNILPLLLLFKKGLRRESNPGHPHPKRVFYHLTTKPSCYYFLIAAMLPLESYIFLIFIFFHIDFVFFLKKGALAGIEPAPPAP